MQERIMQVFYGTDRLPYKDSAREVHYPIVSSTGGGNLIIGENNTTKILFYVGLIGGVDAQWIANIKKPDGTLSYQLCSNPHSVEGDYVVELDISSLYSSITGDVYIAIQGYAGETVITEDDDTYEISGNPTILSTGTIKVRVNYAPNVLPKGETLGFSNEQLILASLGDKVSKTQNETITGVKTFSNGFKVNYIKNPTGTTSFFLGSNLGIGFYDNLIPDYPNKNSIGSAYYTIKDIYMAGALKIGSHYSIKEASNGGLYLYYDGTTEIFSFDDDTVNVAGVLYVDNDISASSDLFLANDFHVSSPSNIKFNTGNTNLQAKLNEKENLSNKVTSVSSSSTDTQYPSAKLFYDTRTDIYDKIENLQSIGRFLSLWNSATGQPTTQPISLPYDYKTGDYFIISNVPSGSATKYMPAGTSYTGTSADRTTTTDELGVGDYFLFDGTQWRLLVNTTKSVTFGQIGGQPSDNNTLVNYLHDNFVPFSGGFENYFQITRDYDQTTGEIEITINTSVIGESYNASTGVLTLTFPS